MVVLLPKHYKFYISNYSPTTPTIKRCFSRWEVFNNVTFSGPEHIIVIFRAGFVTMCEFFCCLFDRLLLNKLFILHQNGTRNCVSGFSPQPQQFVESVSGKWYLWSVRGECHCQAWNKTSTVFSHLEKPLYSLVHERVIYIIAISAYVLP